MSDDEIRDRFTYHPPSDPGKARHEALSDSFVRLAEIVEEWVPDGREKSIAFTKLEEAKFWASAGVARNPETR